MSGHTTKGPWEFHLGIDYACVMGVDQLPDAAFCRLYGISREVEANGHLIAAAPELLAALKAWIGHRAAVTRAALQREPHDPSWTQKIDRIVADAEAAIAKAEGK